MKKKKKRALGVILIVVLVLFCIWQNNYLSESTYDYDVSKIDSGLKGLKIVQISDLHNKKFGKDQRKLLEKIENYQPDYIFVTGDVVDANHTNIDVALDFFEGAVEIAPVYFVIGNHEVWLEEEQLSRLREGMEALGVTYLEHECLRVPYGETGFNLMGLDVDNLYGSGLEQCQQAADPEKFTILLAHEPEYFERYCNIGVDLVFAGHAHGGQVRLPFVGGLVAPGQGFLPKYSAGTFTENSTTMVVSRGLGNSIIPVRVFNFPEIVYMELK